MEVALRRVTLVVKPFRLEDVVAALLPFEPRGLIVSECRGYGRQKGHLDLYQGSEYSITFLPKARVEFSISAHRWKEAVEAAAEAARTGRIGDGKVFVQQVREVAAPGGEEAAS